MKRNYSRARVDWAHDVLTEWASQIRTRPAHDTTVTPGGGFPNNLYMGGSFSGVETARGKEKRRGGPPEHFMGGYIVKGLTGEAARAHAVMIRLNEFRPDYAFVIRAEYGLIDSIDPEDDASVKGKTLGAYLNGRAWPASAYKDKLHRGKEMFAFGYSVFPNRLFQGSTGDFWVSW